MSTSPKQPRLPGVVTLPTYRTARAEWEAAMAAEEEWEKAVEEARAVLASANESLAQARKDRRRRSEVFREVVQQNREEVIEEAGPPDETT